MATRSPDRAPARRRSFFPRLSLTGQIYLAVLVLALAFVVVAVAGWLDAGQQARARSEEQVNNGLQAFQSDLDRATRDLAALGNWLAADATFARLVQARDSAGLTRYLQPWTQVSIADSLLIVDKDGTALTRVSASRPTLTGDNLIDFPGVREALAGSRSTRVGLDTNGRLEQRLFWPVYSPASASPGGVLVASYYLDGTLLQYRSKNPDEHIAVVYNGRISILTLTDQQGKPWGGITAPADLLRAGQEHRSSGLTVVETGAGEYLFRFSPFSSFDGDPTGMFGVGVSLASAQTEQMNLFRAFLIGLGLIALGTAVTAFLFGRSLTGPIQTLERAAEGMASGDLLTPIALSRGDELGDLARQMDRMREQIRQGFQEAAVERSRLAAVIQSMGVATVVTDKLLHIIAVNPAAETLLGAGDADLVGQPWQAVFAGPGKNGNGAQALGEAELKFPTLTVHGRFPLRARPQVTLDVISSQVLVDGQAAGYVHVLQDASRQEQLVQAKDEFIMNAAHELRSPLASLRASIEVLIEDYAVMEKQELGFMLRTIQRAVVRFQGLVENLVDVGNIQAGRFRVRPVVTRIDTLIENAVSQTLPLLQGRRQRADVTIPPGSPCFVLADRPRIVQVLINLISNASKYGPEGEPVCVSASRQDDLLVVEVTDRGPGIPAEEQAQLFKRFYRGRRAEEEGIGIGLGLALAREIVEAHGGHMDVRSQVGSGTTFWFSLRLAEQPQAAAAESRGAGG